VRDKMNDKILYSIIDKYNLTEEERLSFLKIIEPIYEHEEFQRRMTDEFPHHGKFTLGEHILEDAVVTFILSKKYIKKYPENNYSLRLAVIIAMLHDLYTLPWQNNKDNRVKYFFNKHGFRHPIEAVINAYNWYPDLFKKEEEAKIIIDGIVHHMFPLPVRVFDDAEENILELRNFDKEKNLLSGIKQILISSTLRNKIGKISLAKSIYLEGRIMSKADKYVSNRQIKNVSSAIALLSGQNKSLRKK